MKFIDMFCGMRTVRMGFEQAGHECVYSIEWDKHKRKIYEVIFGHEPESSDICTVRGSDLPISDCWCFGAPCQDFSIAGLRNGMQGDRSSLVREVFRLVRETPPEHRPEWLLYENVKGMLSSNKGLDYLEILFEMASLGYDIQYELLNSKDFGVPQNRERVYTIGHSRRFGERKVFPIGESGGIHNEPHQDSEEVYETALCLTAKGESNWTGSFIQTVGKVNSSQDGFVLSPDGISKTLTSGHFNVPKIVEPQVKQLGNVMPTATRDNPNQGRVYDPDGLAPCLNKMEGGGREPLITEPRACLTPDRLEKRQNGRRFKEPGEPMFTLTKQDIHGVAITEATKQGYTIAHEGDSINLAVPNSKTRRGRVGKGVANTLDTSCNQATLFGTRIRRLTPRECMRLQGVGDAVTDKLIAAGTSDTQMYRAAGDACTVNVIYEIARRLMNNE